MLWALRGDEARAKLFIARTLEGKVMLTTHHAWHYAAAAAAVLGQSEIAMDLLERATVTGLPSYPTFRNDRFLAGLENQPRYQRWLNGLEADWLEYRREFGSCAMRSVSFGPCAAVVNSTATPVVVRSAWLRQRYGHVLTLVGGDIQAGGRISLHGANFAANTTVVPAHDALLLTR